MIERARITSKPEPLFNHSKSVATTQLTSHHLHRFTKKYQNSRTAGNIECFYRLSVISHIICHLLAYLSPYCPEGNFIADKVHLSPVIVLDPNWKYFLSPITKTIWSLDRINIIDIVRSHNSHITILGHCCSVALIRFANYEMDQEKKNGAVV